MATSIPLRDWRTLSYSSDVQIFPGWVATLDGRPSPIRLAEPDGFITVEIPAGSHQLEIAFRDTPVRKTAWAVSGLALLFCLLIESLFLSAMPVDALSQPVKPQSGSFPFSTSGLLFFTQPAGLGIKALQIGIELIEIVPSRCQCRFGRL